MSKNIFAYTSPESSYPEFVSINKEEDGTVMITVRSPKKTDGSCGDAASIILQSREILNLSMALAASENVIASKVTRF